MLHEVLTEIEESKDSQVIKINEEIKELPFTHKNINTILEAINPISNSLSEKSRHKIQMLLSNTIS